MPVIRDKNSRIFYVYEHWRPDKNICFCVGKGHGNRAWRFRKRNKYHRNIVEKLRRDGYEVQVKIIAYKKTEKQAFALECKLIAIYRRRGIELTNMTRGGEGTL